MVKNLTKIEKKSLNRNFNENNFRVGQHLKSILYTKGGKEHPIRLIAAKTARRKNNHQEIATTRGRSGGAAVARGRRDLTVTTKPTNPKLYARVKATAKKKFDVWPSAYASSWLVKEYKRRGGKYSGAKPSKSTGLTRWFAEKWINVCKLPKKVSCGRPKTNVRDWKKKYPYCRPSKKITKGTPKVAAELTSAQIRSRCKRKKSHPSKRVLVRKSRLTDRRSRGRKERKGRKGPLATRKRPENVRKKGGGRSSISPASPRKVKAAKKIQKYIRKKSRKRRDKKFNMSGRKKSPRARRSSPRKAVKKIQKDRTKILLISIKRSPKNDKKFQAIFKKGDREIKTNFGQKGASDYTKHKDIKRRNRYIIRHMKDTKTGDPTRAGFLSLYILWNKKSFDASKRDYVKRLNNYNNTGKFPIPIKTNYTSRSKNSVYRLQKSHPKRKSPKMKSKRTIRRKFRMANEKQFLKCAIKNLDMENELTQQIFKISAPNANTSIGITTFTRKRSGILNYMKISPFARLDVLEQSGAHALILIKDRRLTRGWGIFDPNGKNRLPFKIIDGKKNVSKQYMEISPKTSINIGSDAVNPGYCGIFGIIFMIFYIMNHKNDDWIGLWKKLLIQFNKHITLKETYGVVLARRVQTIIQQTDPNNLRKAIPEIYKEIRKVLFLTLTNRPRDEQPSRKRRGQKFDMNGGRRKSHCVQRSSPHKHDLELCKKDITEYKKVLELCKRDVDAWKHAMHNFREENLALKRILYPKKPVAMIGKKGKQFLSYYS